MNPQHHLRLGNSQVQHIVVTLKPELDVQSSGGGIQVLSAILTRLLQSMGANTTTAWQSESWVIEGLNVASVDTFTIAPAANCKIEVEDAWQITNQLHRQPEVLYATLLLHR